MSKEEEKNAKNNDMTEIIKAFKYFDKINNGKIDISDLKFSLTHFGDKMTEDEFYKILIKANIDIEKNTNLDYMKLIKFFNNK